MKWKINNVPNHQPDIGLWIDDDPLGRKKTAHVLTLQGRHIASQFCSTSSERPVEKTLATTGSVAVRDLRGRFMEGTYTFFPNIAVVNLLQKNLILDTS
jgi:hypothetical protein